MKKFWLSIFMLFAFVISTFATALPDEGMWLPMFVKRLNYVDMQKMGLHLTAEEIYSVNHSSLKDAIVGLASGSAPDGYFCTAEVVSDQGLLFTNHHCGFSSVQKHSSVEHDYITDGFWAMSKKEELKNPGLTASFLVRMEDVTSKIIPELSDTLSEADRSAKIKKLSKKLIKEAEEDGKYLVTVKSFFGGNEFYMFVYQTYKDVRLVGAPPSAIGKFGGDTDNWMWPRHTGDFTVFRIYSAPDGSPAEISDKNIPLKPKHHLPISNKSIKKNDFAMIWGYPGGTQRFLTSYGVNYNINDFAPIIIEVFGKKLEVWKKFMDADHNVKIKYASKYAGAANAWKLFIGQKRGLKKLKVYDKKLKIENDFTKWVNADDARKAKYGEALNYIKKGYEEVDKVINPLFFASLCGLRGAEITQYAQNFNQLHSLLKPKPKKRNKEAIKSTIEQLKSSIDKHFKDYYLPADRATLAALLQLYYNNIPKNDLPSVFNIIEKDFNNDFNAYANFVYENSIFATKDKITDFLTKPKFKTLDKDPAYEIVQSTFKSLMKYSKTYNLSMRTINKGNRLFIAGLREMNPDKVYCPDANSTMRLTYGKVLDYYPADAIHYNYFTTLKGVMEKEDPKNDEFIVPAKLKELYNKKDYGPYAENGVMHVCFLTNNDITGGNSGSPVINADGELMGLAFDGNWEAMSGDIAFEPELQRTICVDARYVLFIIDKYAGAKNLIDELDIVNETTSPAKANVELQPANVE